MTHLIIPYRYRQMTRQKPAKYLEESASMYLPERPPIIMAGIGARAWLPQESGDPSHY